MKRIIEQGVIDKLPFVNFEKFTEDENRFVNEWIKYVLQYAKEYNASNEVGVILDRTNWNNYDVISGTEHYVKYNTENMKKWLDEGNNNLIVIHNHPSNSIFSERDVFNFCKTQAVNMLIVVGNAGTIYVMQKLKGFDKYKLIQYYSGALDKDKNNVSRGEILEKTLQEYQEVLNINFIKEEIVC